MEREWEQLSERGVCTISVSCLVYAGLIFQVSVFFSSYALQFTAFFKNFLNAESLK